MVINGHLKFHSSAADELQNVVIEKVDMGATPATFDATSIGGNNSGRLLFNINAGTGNSYWFYDGVSAWVEVGSQALAENLRDAGNVYNTDGTWDSASVDAALANVGPTTDLLDALSDLDQAITAAAGVNELHELLDVDVNGAGTSPAYSDKDTLYYNSGTAHWQNAPAGSTSGVQAYDAALDALSNVSGTGFIVQSAADTFITTSLLAGGAGLEGISISDASGAGDAPTIGINLAGLAAESAPATSDVLFLNDGVNNKKVTAGDLAGLVGTQIPLGDLLNVADANQTGTGGSATTSVTTDNAYFFKGNSGADGYDVQDGTLGALNNVAAGVDTATDEDVLAFNGSQWTAITPSTMLADPDVSIGDIYDVTLTAPANEDILQYNGSAWVNVTPAALAADMDLGDLGNVTDGGGAGHVIYASAPNVWATAAPGATSGVQAHDAGLDALAAAGTGIVSMNGDTVAFRTIVETTANSLTITNGDGVGGNPSFAIDATLDGIAALAPTADQMIYATGADTFAVTTLTPYARTLLDDADAATARTTLDVYSTSEADTNFVDVAGDTMTGNLVMTTGTDITLPDQPTAATDAVNKAYVDALVTSGTIWVDPIKNPDLVGIADDEPTSPLVSGMYIAYGGSYPQNWNGDVTDVAEGDMLHWTFGAWERSGNIYTDTDTTNLLVGVFTNAIDTTAGQDLTTPPFYLDEYVTWIGGGSGDPNLASNWDWPHGRSGAHPGWSATATAATDTIVVSGTDITDSVKVGNEIQIGSSTYTVATVGFATNTTITTVEDLTEDGAITLFAEMRDGITTLTSNPDDSHFGQTYHYVAADDNWVQIAGPGAIEAGVGLSYAGSTLNVNLGAGIKELPSDEVGVDVVSGLALQLTGSATGDQLTFLLDGSNLSQTASGIKIADGTAADVMIANGSGVFTSTTVTGDVTFSSAGVTTIGPDTIEEGMFEGGKTAADLLLVNASGDPVYQTMSGDVTISDAGVTAIGTDKVLNSMILNDHIGVTDGSTSTDISLGDNITFAVGAGTGLAVGEASGTITYSGVNAGTGAGSGTKGVASFESSSFTSTAGHITLAAGGITNAMLANDGITLDADSGSATETVLGGTATIAGGTGITTAVTGTTVTVNRDAMATSDLTDVTAAASAEAQIPVANGSNNYVPSHIMHVHTQSTAAGTGAGIDVNHALGQQYCNVTVCDSSDNVIIPQSITYTDANNLNVKFNSDIECKIIIMGVAGAKTSSA